MGLRGRHGEGRPPRPHLKASAHSRLWLRVSADTASDPRTASSSSAPLGRLPPGASYKVFLGILTDSHVMQGPAWICSQDPPGAGEAVGRTGRPTVWFCLPDPGRWSLTLLCGSLPGSLSESSHLRIRCPPNMTLATQGLSSVPASTRGEHVN